MAVSITSSNSVSQKSARQQRILIATERFWPHAGLSETAIANIALQIKQQKHQVIVASSKGAKNWSTNINFREIPVHRIARPSATPWSSFRYLRAFTKFFSQQEGVDGVVVCGTGDEALAAIRVFGGKVPIVIRIDNNVSNANSSPHRRKTDILKAATHVVSNCDVLAKKLSHSYGISIKSIRDPLPLQSMEAEVSQERSSAKQHNARATLNETHPILNLIGDQPLVVCGMRMHDDPGMIDLIDSWPGVLRQYPDAKLWIIGDGPSGPRVWQQISKLKLVHSVIMPGYFDSLDEIFLAADLVVHPGQTGSACEFLPQAMATALPAVVTKNSWSETFIEPKKSGLVVPPANPQAISEAIVYALKNKLVRNTLGENARLVVNQLYCPKKQTQQYLDLLETPSTVQKKQK